WAQAYDELQNQLEALPKNVSPPKSGSSAAFNSLSAASTQAAAANGEITRKLDNGFSEVKRSLQQIEDNLERRFAGDRVLHEIWNRLYDGRGEPYPKRLPDHFTRDVVEVIQLYRSLSQYYGQGRGSTAETMNAARQVVDELHGLRRKYFGTSLDGNARIEQIVGRIASNYDAIMRDTDHLLPEQTNSVTERVSSLVRE